MYKRYLPQGSRLPQSKEMVVEQFFKFRILPKGEGQLGGEGVAEVGQGAHPENNFEYLYDFGGKLSVFTTLVRAGRRTAWRRERSLDQRG